MEAPAPAATNGGWQAKVQIDKTKSDQNMIMYIYDDRTVENLTRGRYYKYFYERNRRLGLVTYKCVPQVMSVKWFTVLAPA